MAEGTMNQRDLVLAPNEFAYILDETKGFINVYVGPNKTSLANTDKPVVFDGAQKKFVRVPLEASIQNFVKGTILDQALPVAKEVAKSVAKSISK